MQGRICEGSNNFFVVECSDGFIRTCSLKGKKLPSTERFYNPLAPGDFVEILCDEHDQENGQILSLLPRKNAYVRWNVKGRLPQLLAANLSYLFCVTTPESPPFRPRFIDRLLIQAAAEKIEPIILLNKCDLAISAECQKHLLLWEKLGYTVLQIAAQTGEGFNQLVSYLEGNLCAFAGQSGVGKSSIINVLDSKIALRTGSLSEKYDRGTHTTTKGVLHQVHINSAFTQGRENVFGEVIDTPGIRRFVLHNVSAENLIYYFPEMSDLVGSCGFGMSCSHTHEKNCTILDALAQGKIAPERYENWQKIKDELQTGSWND